MTTTTHRDLGAFARAAYGVLLNQGRARPALGVHDPGRPDVTETARATGRPGRRPNLSRASARRLPGLAGRGVLGTVTERDHVACLSDCRATHAGEFRGIPATGRDVNSW